MSIPTSLIVVLLVVAWLVVLVPMVARRREKVPQAEPASSNFRVLRRATASLRRRPASGAKGRTVTDIERRGDSATETARQALVTVGAPAALQPAEPRPADAAEEWAAAQAVQARRAAPMQDAPADDPSAADLPTASDVDQGALWSDESDQQFQSPVRIAPDAVQDDAEQGWVRQDDDSPDGDTRVAKTIADELDEDEWAAHAAAAPDRGSYAEVDAEHLRPVPHRPGRGGFDPEAAEATRAFRYRQRRRVTMILLLAMVAFTVAAAVFINWLWIGAGVCFSLLVGYLAYLRRQVRIEAAIRQKRMERLQRARQIRPEYGRAPRRSRPGMSAVAPGRAAVDLDDDDPSFDDLDDFQRPMTYRRAAGQ